MLITQSQKWLAWPLSVLGLIAAYCLLPCKQLVFLENSGHGMIWEAANLFHSLMVETVLHETYK